MNAEAKAQRRKWWGVATIAFMIVLPLLWAYVTWSQFELIADRARWGKFNLFGLVRVLLSAASAAIVAWMLWGSLVSVTFKRWRKKHKESSHPKNA